MVRLVFILGNNPKLSKAELRAVLPMARFFINSETYVIGDVEEVDCSGLLRRLGGTIKIGHVIGEEVNQQIIIDDLLKSFPKGKVVFGISKYGSKLKSQNSKPHLKIQNLGMGVKKLLKQKGRSVRFITSRDKVLSSVVVTKSKCQEFLILDNEIIAKTCAVQEFEEYSKRDYGRPARDAKSGMLPPKLAKIMINLSQAERDEVILDPFCGSGTILQEAILMGYKNIIGCDISEKAIKASRENINWLKSNLQLTTYNLQLLRCDVKNISQYIQKVDTIITEPYLGPPLTGQETKSEIEKIISTLLELYNHTLIAFSKILKKGGRIVWVVPIFNKNNTKIRLPMVKTIHQLGFQKINQEELIYKRPLQRVQREIMILEK